MSSATTTIKTSVEGIRDAVIRAGFRPGRKVEVTVKYVDAKEVQDSEFARLSAILNKYPAAPEFEGMSEDEVMAYACKMVDEVRQERRETQNK